MWENKTCTVDPSVLELIRDLAQALQAHHLGLTTTESFAKTYDRDLKLINRAEELLSIDEIAANKCEFCNEAESTNKVVSSLDDYPEPEISSLACNQCLQEIQLGHVLKDIYGWSWTKFEGKFIADYPLLEPRHGQEATDVPA